MVKTAVGLGGDQTDATTTCGAVTDSTIQGTTDSQATEPTDSVEGKMVK